MVIFHNSRFSTAIPCRNYRFSLRSYADIRDFVLDRFPKVGFFSNHSTEFAILFRDCLTISLSRIIAKIYDFSTADYKSCEFGRFPKFAIFLGISLTKFVVLFPQSFAEILDFFCDRFHILQFSSAITCRNS